MIEFCTNDVLVRVQKRGSGVILIKRVRIHSLSPRGEKGGKLIRP
jgi:hypothetical protein